MKPLFDLCSGPLKERIRNERKEKLWQPYHDEQLVQIQKKLNDFNLSSKPSQSETSSTSSLNSSTSDDNGSSQSNDVRNKIKLI